MPDNGFTFLPLGAIVQSFVVNGVNIAQGFETADQYKSHNGPFFGETIGRVANRISNHRLDSFNGGKTYKLAANDGTNTLHGGKVGWGKKEWQGPKPVGLREIPGVDGLEGGESVEFTLTSKDGDEGFPGTVEATIVYTTGTVKTDSGKEAVVLAMDYSAKLVDGADETPINMTNHTYFNPAGVDAETYADTQITLSTVNHLPVDDRAIPTGAVEPFPNLSANTPFTLHATEPFIDHCFTVSPTPSSIPIDTRTQPLDKHVQAYNPNTKIHLEVLSTEPAFQFYTGDGINVPAVGALKKRGKRSGFCCEPSRWVDAANRDEWKAQVTLKKGETYGCRIVYKAWAD
ncbi:aldose 1-epimerase domain-containing protein [Sarocladium implicatum]|nr:aldose 1-epimerase domain-containing protein [Sarocladium implicatum]